MRPRFVIFILLAVAIILAIVFWLRPLKPTIVTATMPEVVKATDESIISSNTIGKKVTNVTVQSPSSSTNLKPSVANPISLAEVTERFVESRNKPIEFYGQVIDQNGNAVSGAKIKIGITHLTVPNPLVPELVSKTIQMEQTSDANGRFEFHGETGEGFGVGIIKDGYELEQNKYGSGPTAGSYDNPVVFKMWSTNIHEQLITGGKSFNITPDGRPYFINLTNGTISESSAGDLKVWVKRPDQIIFGKKYDWACEVDALNGGGLFQESDSSVSMYQAPADGYTNSFSYIEDASANGWGDTTGAQRFYIRLNGQNYGRVTIELEAYHNSQTPSLIRLSYTINPSGSHILR